MMLSMMDGKLTDHHEENMNEEPDAVKVARPVRKGTERKGPVIVPRSQSTLHLARFVRMTLSFSKSVVMHEACVLLFLYR